MTEYIDSLANKATKNIEEHKKILEYSIKGEAILDEYIKNYKMYTKLKFKNKDIIEVKQLIKVVIYD